jgi:hypothetical protein
MASPAVRRARPRPSEPFRRNRRVRQGLPAKTRCRAEAGGIGLPRWVFVP